MSGHASLIKAPGILQDALAHLVSSHGNIRACSVATIKESVAAIEAFTNELAEIGYGYEVCGHSESNPIVLMGRKLKDAEKTRTSIKSKIQIACEALSGKKFLKGGIPTYQKFSIVVDVRNELTHPKASVIKISGGGLVPPKGELKILQRLKSYGFTCAEQAKHDWTSAVQNKNFAEWAHLRVVEMMYYVIYLWPHKEAIDSYIKLYGLDRYRSESSGSACKVPESLG